MRDITDLARQAAGQRGLLTSHDLHRLGFGRHERATLTGCGLLQRVRRGLFVIAGTPDTWEHRMMRACLAPSQGGVASHRSALRLWDLRGRDDDGEPIEITVRGTAPTIEGVVVHHSGDLEPTDVHTVAGIPVTSVARTLCDAGAVLPERVVGWLTERAIGVGLVSIEELHAFRRRVARRGRDGVGPLGRRLDDLPRAAAACESPQEIALARLLRDHGMPEPVPQFELEARGHRFRIDLAYPPARLLLEYDGYDAHVGRAQFGRDRWRQNLLVLDGWTVLRFTLEDLRERPTWLVGRVREALRRAKGETPGETPGETL